ncbi:MAG: ATP-dependent helicase, partial [Hyphomicrobiales bacterium]
MGDNVAWSDGVDPKSPAFQIAASTAKRMRVIAGPGTGKSFAMKRRVARLLEDGIKPKEILSVTFTRVAAEDLHRELIHLGVPGCDDLEGRTLHSLGLQILSRKHVFSALGRTPQPLNHFEEDLLLCDLKALFGGKTKAGELLQEYVSAWAVAQGDEPGFPANSEQEKFAKAALDWLKFHQAMLIGEIVPYLLLYLKHNPAAEEHAEFKHVLTDEYQDLNKAEQTIMSYLSANAHACIVGDDDQSIYSFKFAHPEGIREWHTINPGTSDHALDECQRCPTTVVEMANALIAHNQNRKPRVLKGIAAKGKGDVEIVQLKTLAGEVNWIVDRVVDLTENQSVLPGEI